MQNSKKNEEPVVVDSLTIRGQEIPVATVFLQHTRLRFFADNPRIYSIVRANGKEPTQEEIQEQLLQLEHVRTLIQDIRQNGGLTDPLVVINDSFEVVEGNSRLAAYRHLARQDAVRWGKVKCMLLPADIDRSLLFTLLGQYHIKGKKDWAPYEQAGFLYRRSKEHNFDAKVVANEIGLSSRKIRHLIDTYQFMIDHQETATDRWSYYDEYLKSSKIRKARRKHAGLDQIIVKKVKSGEIKKAVDIREQLPLICEAGPRVLKKFVDEVFDFEDAHEYALAGGGDSPQLKKLIRFRDWLTDDEKVEPIFQARGETRRKILFELGKLASRVSALRSRLEKG